MANKLVYSGLVVFLSFLLGACSVKTEETPETNEREGKESQSTENNKWSYEGDTGPEHWGELDQANSVCVNGSEQSPINIEFSQVKTDRKTENIQIQYEPTSFTIVNNGHSVQANASTESNSIIVEGNKYKLVQFHFHTPSEHQFNGKNYDMELHLVHKDANGKIAVLGVMIQEGKVNEKLSPIWDVLPKEETSEGLQLKGNIDIQGILPQDQKSFHYNGSLTTPPCTEKVEWVLFKQPIEMSKKQVEEFQSIFPDNHRPVQSTNNRKIFEVE